MTIAARSSPAPACLDEGEFAELAVLLHDEPPLAPPEDETFAPATVALRSLRAIGLRSFGEYCRLVANSGASHPRGALRVAETPRLMAEPRVFQHLLATALPDLAERVGRGGSLRIWSAGCGGGHEPYTVAMAILSLLPDAGRADIRILGSDLDPNRLAEARAGLYREDALESLPAEWRERWLVRLRGGGDPVWQVAEDLRDLVAFRELNLFGAWPMRRPFDLVLCRNVLTPFPEPRQLPVWRRFAGAMRGRGVLYAGRDEDAPAKAGFVGGDGVWRPERSISRR